MIFVLERLADGVFRGRLSSLDVTVGPVYGRTGALLIDTGTTLTEARAIAEDVRDIANREVSHIVLTQVPRLDRRHHRLRQTVVFCGDFVEKSGDPAIGADSDPVAWPATLERVIVGGGEDAVFLPGHGAVVDAAFVRRQRDWLSMQM